MSSWTYSTGTLAIVVTADNVDLAIEMIESALYDQNIDPIYFKRAELIPLPVFHRHVRILYNRNNNGDEEVQE